MDSTTGKQSKRINHVEALDGVVKATLGCPCESIFSAAFYSTLLFHVRNAFLVVVVRVVQNGRKLKPSGPPPAPRTKLPPPAMPPPLSYYYRSKSV